MISIEEEKNNMNIIQNSLLGTVSRTVDSLSKSWAIFGAENRQIAPQNLHPNMLLQDMHSPPKCRKVCIFALTPNPSYLLVDAYLIVG